MPFSIGVLTTAMLATFSVAARTFAQNQPPAGYAMRFNGTNAFVAVPDHALLDFDRSATLELWVRFYSLREPGTSSRILCKGDGINSCSDIAFIEEFNVLGGGCGFHYQGCGYTAVPGDPPPQLNTWVHLAYTFDADTRRWRSYWNGTPLGSYEIESRGIRNSSRQLTIGGDPNYGFMLAGEMDEVRLWNTVRTPAEIAASYNTTVPTNSPGLVAYYTFDEGSGTTVQDRTGNGLNGTVNGGATWVEVGCAPPAATGQPVARTTCEGESVSFTAAFSGTSPSLQWRRDGQPLVGATGATLTIASPTVVDAGMYDCVATNACGSVTTDAAELTVQTAPTITTQPVAQALVPGATASFSIAAEGGELAYQWRRNGTALTSAGRISGATTSSLSVTAVTGADQGTYDCVVTGACGSVTSSTAALSCTPVFTQQPQGGEFPGGSTITLATGVSTAGTTTYRWRKNGVALFNSLSFSGTTTPTLVINANDPNDSGEYTLSVANACGTTLSAAAVVEVTCLSDFNRDGGVDGEDLFAFFTAWEGGLSDADTNQDGGIDGGDVNAFFAKWEAGC